ncbi:MAG: hypothetical protein PHE25_03340 [Candidatus Gracilibacteria bacterium]|nr:hypothetical protein [Candidatus Gracilibacteria bacterium]
MAEIPKPSAETPTRSLEDLKKLLNPILINYITPHWNDEELDKVLRGADENNFKEEFSKLSKEEKKAYLDYISQQLRNIETQDIFPISKNERYNIRVYKKLLIKKLLFEAYACTCNIEKKDYFQSPEFFITGGEI